MRPAFLLSLVLFVAPARAVDFQGGGRLWLGPGMDSNPQRDFVSPPHCTTPDAFFFGFGQLEGALRLGDRVRLTGSYEVSGRKFFTAATEDTVVQLAQLDSSVSVADFLALGLSARARDRRGAKRDYTDLQGGAVLDFHPDPAVTVRAQLNAHRFLFYHANFPYSFWGPDATVSARYRFDRRHSLSVFGSYHPRTYNSDARPRPGPEGSEPPPEVTRSDAVFGGGLSYSYRGPFHFTFSYAYLDQTSNSFGETVWRHRLSATGGLRLPWQLTLLSSLTWQPALFPEGIYLSKELILAEDDGNVSSLTFKLVRTLLPWLELDVRYAGFLGFLPQNNFIYVRHVVSVGLEASF